MPRESAPAAPPPAAQITICGALNRDTIAALVDLAMTAGAALLVQPRALAPPSGVVMEELHEHPKALLPALRRAGRTSRKGKPVRREPRAPAVDADVMDRVRRALRDGPTLVADFLRATRLSKYDARKLVLSGALIASGGTHSRRYALPGHSAKEAP